jgi:hypothetical protein
MEESPDILLPTISSNFAPVPFPPLVLLNRFGKPSSILADLVTVPLYLNEFNKCWKKQKNCASVNSRRLRSSLSTVTFANMEARTKISEEERKKLAEYRCVAESFHVPPYLPCAVLQDDRGYSHT